MMSEAAEILPVEDLAPFEGTEVVGTSVKITNAGDGLSAALTVLPVELKLGDRVWMALEGIVVDVQHPLGKSTKDDPEGDEKATRKHVVKTVGATLVGEVTIGWAIRDTQAKIKRAHDEKRGIQTLEVLNDDPGPSDEQGEPGPDFVAPDFGDDE